MKRSSHRIRIYEYQEFLDFNDFGPEDGSDQPVINQTYTLDEFIGLPHFEIVENAIRAVQAIKNDEKIVIQCDNQADIEILPSDDHITVTVKYDKTEVTFNKNELLNAMLKTEYQNESVEVEEELELDKEMQSVKTFKKYFEIIENVSKYNDKDNF